MKHTINDAIWFDTLTNENTCNITEVQDEREKIGNRALTLPEFLKKCAY